MRKLLMVTLIVFLAVNLSGCRANQPEGYDVDSIDDLTAALASLGYTVTIIDPEEEGIHMVSFFSIYPTYVKINEEEPWISVYEFPDSETAIEEAETISEDGHTVGNAQISWISKPHFYQKNRLILHHISTDEKRLADFASILGQPIR